MPKDKIYVLFECYDFIAVSLDKEVLKELAEEMYKGGEKLGHIEEKDLVTRANLKERKEKAKKHRLGYEEYIKGQTNGQD